MAVGTGEELGDVIHIVQLWVQQRLACSKRRRKKVKRMKRREWAVGSGQGKRVLSAECWVLREDEESGQLAVGNWQLAVGVSPYRGV